jgi:cupin fold WbuC family metalloprotein
MKNGRYGTENYVVTTSPNKERRERATNTEQRITNRIIFMKILDRQKVEELVLAAEESPRKRVHFCFHDSNESDIHKLYIASQPGSYIRPHRHVGDGRWEMLTIIQGAGILFIFDGDGNILSKTVLSLAGDVYSVELNENVWHAFVTTARDTIFQEVKAGPYIKPSPNDFAAWSPQEGDSGVPQFIDDLKAME